MSRIKRYEPELDEEDNVWMAVYAAGQYVTFADHTQSIAAKDEEIARLKDELEEEERSHENSLRQRDDAEDALGDAFAFVTGRSAEWSNVFGYEEATTEIAEVIHDMSERIAELEQQLKERGCE